VIPGRSHAGPVCSFGCQNGHEDSLVPQVSDLTVVAPTPPGPVSLRSRPHRSASVARGVRRSTDTAGLEIQYEVRLNDDGQSRPPGSPDGMPDNCHPGSPGGCARRTHRPRCVGPRQVARITLVTSVDLTEARKTSFVGMTNSRSHVICREWPRVSASAVLIDPTTSLVVLHGAGKGMRMASPAVQAANFSSCLSVILSAVPGMSCPLADMLSSAATFDNRQLL
jgi:hypothetical protein